MSLSDYKSVQVSDFSGAWTRREITDLPPEAASLANNCEFGPGNVSTRKGFTAVWNPNEPISSMWAWTRAADWISNGSLLFYYNSTSRKVRYVPRLDLPVPADAFTATSGAVGAIGVETATYKTAVCTYDSNCLGKDQVRVVNFSGVGFPPAVVADKAFPPPITTKPTLAEGAAGSVTAGLHRVGYVIESRTGFVGKLCPCDSGGNYDTTSNITASGDKTITFSATATWPADSVTIWPFMTSTTNLTRYFLVPGLSQAVTGGASSTVNFTFDISDDDLIATGTEITDSASLLTQTQAGAGPFNPHFMCTFGFRTVYLTEYSGLQVGFASEPSKPFNLSADQHQFALPGFKQMICAQPMGRVLYLFGPHWTFAVEDNGGVPAEWPTPALVDAAIGTMSPRGVALSASGGFLWVADQSGLYAFSGGQYSKLPVSYECDPDWRRINWSVAHTLQVIDHPTKQQVYVIAALDSATAPSHILCFDYSNGLDSQSVKYSLWSLTGYAPGAGCIVQHPTTKRLELWIGKTTAGKVLRQTNDSDTNPYRDDAVAIPFTYRTSLFPGSQEPLGSRHQHNAVQFRAKGSGTLAGKTYSLDGAKSFTWKNTALASAPGAEYTRMINLQSEGAYHEFSVNEVDGWVLMSALKHLYNPAWTTHR